MGKEQSFQQMVLRKLDNHMQKNEVDSYLMPYVKISSKWVKDLSIRAKAIMFCVRQKRRRKAL